MSRAREQGAGVSPQGGRVHADISCVLQTTQPIVGRSEVGKQRTRTVRAAADTTAK